MIEPRAGLHILSVGAHGDVIDESGHVRDAYDLSPGDWILVRPDGYVGAAGAADDLPALTDYLGGAGVTHPGA
jgi:hypothetical protein